MGASLWPGCRRTVACTPPHPCSRAVEAANRAAASTILPSPHKPNCASRPCALYAAAGSTSRLSSTSRTLRACAPGSTSRAASRASEPSAGGAFLHSEVLLLGSEACHGRNQVSYQEGRDVPDHPTPCTFSPAPASPRTPLPPLTPHCSLMTGFRAPDFAASDLMGDALAQLGFQ